MSVGASINQYIAALKGAHAFEGQIVYHREFEPTPAVYGRVKTPWPQPITQLLHAMDIKQLYSHQVQTMDRVRCGIHTVAATPTASGKTLIYTLPVIEAVLSDASATALFIYPLKALAQDQLKTVSRMADALPEVDLQAQIYDGDTTAYRRKKIREHPPHILMTNPEMVHLSILPHHDRWGDLLGRLRFVVIDEVHVYRGGAGRAHGPGVPAAGAIVSILQSSADVRVYIGNRCQSR